MDCFTGYMADDPRVGGYECVDDSVVEITRLEVQTRLET